MYILLYSVGVIEQLCEIDVFIFVYFIKGYFYRVLEYLDVKEIIGQLNFFRNLKESLRVMNRNEKLIREKGCQIKLYKIN